MSPPYLSAAVSTALKRRTPDAQGSMRRLCACTRLA